MGNVLTIADLTSDPANARRHNPRNIGMIEQSLHDVGAARSIVIDEDGVILAGNGLVEAAAQAGIERVRVIEGDGNEIIAVRRSNLTPEQKTMLALYDNRTTDLSDFDPAVLASLADDGVDLSGLWFPDELGALLDQAVLPESGGGGDEFDPTPEDGPTRTVPGDLWSIGKVHRLLVGDCTDAANVARLMGGERAALCFTSPPYNVAAESSLPNRNKYRADRQKYFSGDQPDNRDEPEYLSFLALFTSVALEHSEYVFVNVQSVAGNKTALIDYLSAFRDKYADTIIWDKLTAEPAMARNVLNSRFEYIHVFSQKANRAIGTRGFRGTLENVYSLNSRQDKEFSDIHRATFPLVFPSFFIEQFMNAGELVLEPFLGTGTTLIAAHRTGRRCYGMEISCRYADVILRRAEAEGLEVSRIDD